MNPRTLLPVFLFAVLTLAALPVAAQVTAAPGSVDAALEAGSTTSITLALHNAGSAPADIRLVPRRAGSDGRGILWAYDSHLLRIDPVTGEELTRLPHPRATGGLREGMAFDGDALYFAVGNTDNGVFKLDATTGEVVDAMRLPWGVELDALAHTGRAFYGSESGAPGRLHELDIDEGRIVRTLELGVSTIGGLTAGGSRGTLFVTGNDDAGIYEVDPATGTVLRGLPVSGFLVALGYSEELGLLFVNRLVGGAETRTFAVDPDTGAEVYALPSVAGRNGSGALAADEAAGVAEWLALGQRQLTLPASGSAEVAVLLDAATLTDGGYVGEIAVFVGDAEAPAAVVPVALAVTGSPSVAVEPASGSLLFDGVFAGATAERVITVHNSGTASLTVLAAGATELVTVDVSTFTLAPGRTRSLAVRVTPLTPGAHASSIFLQTDDPARPSVSVPVEVRAIPAPDLALSDDALTVTVAPGATATASLTLANEGESPLTYRVFGGWDGLLAPGRVTPAGYLPTVIADPAGDALGGPDLVAVRAAALRDTVFFELEFAEDVAVTDGYYIDFSLDTDQDAATGEPSPRFFLDPTIGAEFGFALWSEYSTVMNEPVLYDGARVRFGIPLTSLGGDDGRMDVVVVIQNHALEVTEVAPPSGVASGFGSVGGPVWLSVAPEEGAVAPGASITVTLAVDAGGLAAGTYEGALLLGTDDPAASEAGSDVVVPLTLVVGTATSDEGDGTAGLPAAHALHPVYPNPVATTATVEFELPASAPVVLTLYDVRGRAVRELVDEERPAGAHAVTFDASELVAGLYLCRLQAGAFAATQKVIILR